MRTLVFAFSDNSDNLTFTGSGTYSMRLTFFRISRARPLTKADSDAKSAELIRWKSRLMTMYVS